MNILSYLNKIEYDNFSKPSAVLALNKPVGITSHDLVDEVRKRLKTRAVGHAGALDPFASGLLIVLVGRATKLSNEIMCWEKTYRCKIGFGISTTTQDTEGELTSVRKINKIDKEKIVRVLMKFEGDYEQYVPVYSSIKYKGNRLRELARSCEHFVISSEKGKKYVEFIFKSGLTKGRSKFIKTGTESIKLEIPKRTVNISKIKLLKIGRIEVKDIPFPPRIKSQIQTIDNFDYCEVELSTSKGTYVRQLAEDIGEKYGKLPAFLFQLERTRIGKITLKNIITLEDLY